MIETALHNEKVKNSQNPLADVFGSDGAAHLKRLLLHKADKIDIEKMYEIKADKKETTNVVQAVKSMTDFFKQILVMFISLASAQTIKANDTTNSIENRNKNLVS
jgi:phosphoribosylformylglycinamidine (FGAM) synthase PurS component